MVYEVGDKMMLNGTEVEVVEVVRHYVKLSNGNTLMDCTLDGLRYMGRMIPIVKS